MTYISSAERFGMEVGLKKGMEKGKLEGKLEAKLEIAGQLLSEAKDLAYIARITQLSVETIKKLQEEVAEVL